ncbi:MAG: glycosyl transferase group 1 [Fibrobacteres bacterium]|nr:glycosyl transferase group 1 [Fibrobacterota bacterium]
MNRTEPRILINALFLQAHLGGIGNYCHELLRVLMRRHPDHRFTLLIPEKAAPNFTGLGEDLELWRVGIRSTALRQLYHQFILPFAVGRFRLIHSIGNIGMVLSPITQVITLHDTYEKVSPERFSWLKRCFMGWLISLSGRRAARVITDSANTAKDIARFYPHMAPKTTVVYLGNKYPVADPAEGRARRHFLFVGTLEPGKNLATVLRAFALFRKGRAEKLLIVGAMGWNQGALPELVDSLGIRGDVDFMGYITDDRLREIYASSRALILASSYEGFGLPAIEAMACGCPTILARNSSLPEAGGDSSLFFSTFDHGELARRMEEICSDEDLIGRTVRTGADHARKFTWDKTADETFAIYRQAGLRA